MEQRTTTLSLFAGEDFGMFQERPQPRACDPIVITVSPYRLQGIQRAHTEILCAMNRSTHTQVQQPRKPPFVHGGKLYRCTGWCSPSREPNKAFCIEMVSLNEAPNLQYREWAFYHGLRMEWKGAIYVLRGPEVHFTDGLVPHHPLTNWKPDFPPTEL